MDTMSQRRIVGCFATGVTLITTGDGDSIYGMTANAFLSLSLDPPLVLVAVGRHNQTREGLLEHRCFAVNVLAADQEALARRFAKPGPKDFSDVATKVVASGAPILREALAFVDCRVVEILPAGDHDIFIGEVLAGDSREGDPLLFYRGGYTELQNNRPVDPHQQADTADGESADWDFCF